MPLPRTFRSCPPSVLRIIRNGPARSAPGRRNSPGVAVVGLLALAAPLLPAAAPALAQASPALARSGHPAPSARPIPGPVRHGHLRIAGRPRDGGVVRAAGLTFTPGALPRGDKLLSFEVGYSWTSCGSAGHCRAGAGVTATPFAARQYRAGHADTGRRLAVTVTATEVVETDPATFSFRAVRATARAQTSGRVRGYPAGRAPSAAFVNGTPERVTGSDAEYFSVSAPHYNAGGGAARQWYQVDRRGWRALPSSRVFFTGILGAGRHQVAVRTGNRYGSSIARFRWRVVPLPAPAPCRGRCWFPPHLAAGGHPMRWDWQIGRVTPRQRTGRRAVDIYDIDGFLTTRAQLRALHTRWQAATLPHPKAVCYLDLAWEDYRPDGSPGRWFPAATLGKIYYGYPQERWVDLRQLHALEPMLDRRLAMCAAKGFDAVELDDIDSFDPPSVTGFHLTPGDLQNFLAAAFNQIHRLGMTGLWKNSPLLSWWGRRYADGAVVEECYRYHGCTAAQLRGTKAYGITCTALTGATPCGWDDFAAGKTARQPSGKWVGEAEYGADHYVCNPGQSCRPARRFATFCRKVQAPRNGFAAVKFDVDLDGRVFYPCPRGT